MIRARKACHSTHTRRRDIAFFVALMATALALGGALAHALELPNKIGMSREDYSIAQQLYAGWNRLAFLLAIQAAGMLALIVIYWRALAVLRPVVVALGVSSRRRRFSGSGRGIPLRPKWRRRARDGSARGARGASSDR